MSEQSQICDFALIVAAGNGTRVSNIDEGIPKQFQNFMGKPLFLHSIEALAKSRHIDKIMVVIGSQHKKFYTDALPHLSDKSTNKLLPYCEGGETRQKSVYLGLQALKHYSQQNSNVYIHDAARPFIFDQTLKSLSEALENKDIYGAVPTIPVIDTLKRCFNNAYVESTVNRANLFCAQTPQAFKFSEIMRVHEIAHSENFMGTDDASLMEQYCAFKNVVNVEGNRLALKITHSEDWQMAELFYNNLFPTIPDIRTALGFDIHRFTNGDFITLAGVKIPHIFGVEAHSDGDVVLHALTDAILGLFGGGDIGQLFPNTDAKWENAPSEIFVKDALAKLHLAGGQLTHIDITILSEAPKISTFRSSMLDSLKSLTNLPLHHIGLKATTMEKLGSLGRNEGVAAQVLVSGYFQ